MRSEAGKLTEASSMFPQTTIRDLTGVYIGWLNQESFWKMPGNKDRAWFWWTIKEPELCRQFRYIHWILCSWLQEDRGKSHAQAYVTVQNIHFEIVHLFFQLTFSSQNFLSIRFLIGLIYIASGAIKMSGTQRQHKASLLNEKSPGGLSRVDYCHLLLAIMV